MNKKKKDKKPKLTQTQKMFWGSLRPCWAQLWKWDFRKVVALVLLLDQLLWYCCCYWWWWKCSQAGSLLQESLLSPSSAGGLWFFFFCFSLSFCESKELELEQGRRDCGLYLRHQSREFLKGRDWKNQPTERERVCNVFCLCLFLCVCDWESKQKKQIANGK